MSATDVHETSRDASVGRVDMKLEVMIIPVSDVDRSKVFYERLGWSLDRDVAPMEGLRIVQFTPPGSGTSVTLPLLSSQWPLAHGCRPIYTGSAEIPSA